MAKRAVDVGDRRLADLLCEAEKALGGELQPGRTLRALRDDLIEACTSLHYLSMLLDAELVRTGGRA